MSVAAGERFDHEQVIERRSRHGDRLDAVHKHAGIERINIIRRRDLRQVGNESVLDARVALNADCRSGAVGVVCDVELQRRQRVRRIQQFDAPRLVDTETN